MPTAITLAAPASFASPLFPPLPAISNLSLWTYFGGSLAQCLNAGNAGALANAPNAPTYAANYIGCHGYLGALVLPSFTPGAQQTWMGVARYTGGGTSGAVAQLHAPGGAGLAANLSSNSLALVGNGITAPVALSVPNTSIFKFYAITVTATGPHTIYNETDNTSQVAAASGTLTPTAGAIGIGGTYNSSGTNDRGCDIAWEGWSQGALAKATIDQVYAHVKAVLASRGITGV